MAQRSLFHKASCESVGGSQLSAAKSTASMPANLGDPSCRVVRAGRSERDRAVRSERTGYSRGSRSCCIRCSILRVCCRDESDCSFP
jgi:hypothetical protein